MAKILKQIAKRIPISFMIVGTYRMIRYSRRAKQLQKKYPLRIMNAKESVNFIVANHLSVGRFGDGEFDLIIDGRDDIGFQVNDKSLRDSLEMVLISPKDKFIVGLPYMFVDVTGFRFWVSSAWRYYITKFLEPVANFVNNDNLFVATGFTRPYFEYKDRQYSREIISNYDNLWASKNVLIVEGKNTRFGIGNSLLSNADQIKRILAPNENAWSKKDVIKEKVFEFFENKNNNEWVVLIALGPTATVLAYELSEYVQSIDVGHMDLHFDYFQNNAKKIKKVKGKYVNEVPGGRKVAPVTDKSYFNQIVFEIN